MAEEWACKAQDTASVRLRLLIHDCIGDTNHSLARLQQLSVCYTLAESFGSLPVQQKRDIVRRVFRGTRPAAGHMAMWLATAFVDGRGMGGVDTVSVICDA